jgi:uncharacterized membrane protein
MENQEEKVITPEVMPTTEKEAGTPTDNTTLMSVLAYIGILVLIPYLMAKENPVVKFHIKQGLVLLVIEMAVFVGSEIMWGHLLAPVFMIINLATLVLSIIGIMNVLQKKQTELPLVGVYAKHFTI